MRDALEEVIVDLEVAPPLDPEVDEDFDPSLSFAAHSLL
jgi:hypothetical protein